MMFSILVENRQINESIDDTTTIFSPRLIVEMGKAGSLEFGVPASHFIYGQLFPLVTVITVEYDGREIFRGRVLSSERGFNNSRKIYCEGILSYLVDSQIKGEKYDGNTHELFRMIVGKHNDRVEAKKQFTVGIIGIENRSVILTGQSDQTADPETGVVDYKQIAINAITDTWKTSFDYIETCLIDYCGGYLRVRHENGINYLDLILDYGSTTSQEIEFGINLLDLVEGDSADEIFTVLIPLGDDNLDISEVNDGSDELVDEEAVEKYGRIVKTHVFSNVNQASTLLENAQRFMVNERNNQNTFTVKAVDFHMVDSSVSAIYVGDRVHVNSAPHGIQEYMICTRIEYDLENPENNTYTFGNPHQTLTERYRKDKQKTSDRGASGAGAAGQEAQDEIDRIYDAYINVDPEAGSISLGALCTLLQTQVGIDLNAAEGNVNITALKQTVDANTGLISNTSARIDTLASNTEGSINLLTGYYDEVSELASGNYAAIQLLSNSTGSLVSVSADLVNIAAKKTEIASLTIQGNDLSIPRIITTNINAAVATITDLRAVTNFSFLGNPVSTTTITAVTSFTQALGEQASTTTITVLTTNVGTTRTLNVAAGGTVTFQA